MPYEKIENWKYGLDSRRSELSSQPGTLQQLTNGHVNQGGEIEKRKAFFAQALPTGTGYTFGMQPTGSNIIVFGSAATPGAFPITFTNTLGPTVILYQQLQHPADIAGGTTNTIPMVAIIWSSAFGGNTTAIAKFNDGYVFGYYNGTPIYDFTNGIILPFENTNAKIAQELVNEFNRNATYSAAVASPTNEFNVTGPVGQFFTVATTKTSASGTVTNSTTSTGFPGTPANPAVCQFTIVAGVAAAAGVNQFTSITVEQIGGSTTEILGANIDFVTDEAHSASAVATQINSFQNNYVASASNNVVTIAGPASSGASINGFEIHVSIGGTTGAIVLWNGPITYALAVGATSFDAGVNHGTPALTINGTDALYNPTGPVDSNPIHWGNTYGGITVNSVINLVAALAYMINNVSAGGSVTNFCAVAKGTTLYPGQKSMRSSDFPFTTVANVTTGGAIAAGTNVPYGAQASPAVVNRGRSQTDPASATCSVFGGTPPYFYTWKELSTGSGANMFPASPFAPTTSFTVQLPPGLAAQGGSGTFICTVTDSSTPSPLSTTSNIVTVTFPHL